MNIKNIGNFSAVSVTTDESEYNEYLRLASDVWLVMMGNSFEYVYNTTKLEDKYQKYLLTNSESVI